MPLRAKAMSHKFSLVATETLKHGPPTTSLPSASRKRVLFFEASTYATPHTDYISARMADDCVARGASRASGRGRARLHAASHA
jgi:hypothetical protein